MTDLRAAAQQALEALIHMCHNTVAEKGYDGQQVQNAIDGLEAALAQPEQEQADYPEEKLQAVAEYVSNQYHVWYGVAARDIEEVLRQSVSCGLVSNPPRREWQSLTDEEMVAIAHRKCWEYRHSSDPHHSHTYKFNHSTLTDFRYAIEAALKERNA